MKRSLILVALIGTMMVAPAWAGNPTAKKAVAGVEGGVTTVAVTVSSSSDEIYGVVIDGARIEDIRAPKGWVGVSSGSSAVFRTSQNPVKGGNSLAFRVMTTEPAAGLKVSFRGKDDPVGQPATL
jgi:hypothetical protein